MPTFSINVDLSHLMPPEGRLTAEAFPSLAHAVRLIGQQAHADWVDFAMGKPLPSGLVIRNRTGEYARSIGTRETGPFSVEVSSHLRYARYIEEGTPAHDMKKMLDSSFKVRLTKDGRRYLVIPFFHSRHTGMTDDVQDWFRNRQASHIAGTFRRLSGTGAFDIRTRRRVTVPGWRYSWGDKLRARDLAGLGVTGVAAKRMQGMVNFRNPGGAAGGGAKAGSHSQFITFRRMVQGSKGWMARAQPGKYPARTVADQLRPVAQEAFAAAMAADIAALLASG